MTDTTNLPPFGESEYLSAASYQPGTKIKCKVVEFLGAQEYETTDGSKKTGAYYSVIVDSTPRKYRMSTSVQQALRDECKIKDYQGVVGKVLVLKVKKYGVGNGFELHSLE